MQWDRGGAAQLGNALHLSCVVHDTNGADLPIGCIYYTSRTYLLYGQTRSAIRFRVVRLIRAKLLGESLREVGVLILVFVPLDGILMTHGERPLHHPLWFDGAGVFLFIGLAIIMLYLGIKLETEATVALEAGKGGNHNGDSNGPV